MQLSSGYENHRARVELLPMIDVVFLLLVFFIYAMMSMVVHRGMSVRLPFAATAEVDKHQFVTLTITKDNQVLLEGEPIAMSQIGSRVKQRLESSSDKVVFISGDPISPDTGDFISQTGNPLITKPFSLDELMKTVRDLWDLVPAVA